MYITTKLKSVQRYSVPSFSMIYDLHVVLYAKKKLKLTDKRIMFIYHLNIKLNLRKFLNQTVFLLDFIIIYI